MARDVADVDERDYVGGVDDYDRDHVRDDGDAGYELEDGEDVDPLLWEDVAMKENDLT